MALCIIEHGSANYVKMVEFRDEILRKPLGLSFSKEDLDAERNDLLVAALEEEQILACCVLTTQQPGTARLKQMAVRPGVQGKGLGRALIRFAEAVARDHGYTKMTMHARKTAVGFYEKMGYTLCSPEFEEVTIPHYTMEKPLIPF